MLTHLLPQVVLYGWLSRFMNSRLRYSRSEAGWTLLDLLIVIISGTVLATWVSRYFHISSQIVIGGVLAPIFGVGFWRFLVWLLPLINRFYKSLSRLGNDSDQR